MGTKRTVTFSKGTWHKIRNSGKIRVHREGVTHKCEPHERSPCAPSFAERTQDETLHQERRARRIAQDLARSVYKLINTDRAPFYSPIKARATPAPTSKSPEEREFVVDSEASTHMLRKKRIELRRNGDSAGNPGTPQRWGRPTRKSKQTREHKYTFTILISSGRCKYSMTRLQFYHLENSAKNTDLPVRGPAVKNHG